MQQELLDYLAYSNTPRLSTAITLGDSLVEIDAAERRAAAEAVNRVLGVVWLIATRPRRNGSASAVRAELAALCHLGSTAHAALTEREIGRALGIHTPRVCEAIERVRVRYMNGQETRPKAGQGSWQR